LNNNKGAARTPESCARAGVTQQERSERDGRQPSRSQEPLANTHDDRLSAPAAGAPTLQKIMM
jgi:hypothetical protein